MLGEAGIFRGECLCVWGVLVNLAYIKLGDQSPRVFRLVPCLTLSVIVNKM